MNPLKFIIAFLLGVVGTWLLLWDFIDFLTQGFNDGAWKPEIVMSAYPSIFVGFIFVLVAGYLGWSAIKGG